MAKNAACAYPIRVRYCACCRPSRAWLAQTCAWGGSKVSLPGYVAALITGRDATCGVCRHTNRVENRSVFASLSLVLWAVAALLVTGPAEGALAAPTIVAALGAQALLIKRGLGFTRTGELQR